MPSHKLLHKSLDEFTTAPVAAPAEAGRRLLDVLLRGYDGPVAVRLWDGSYARGGADAPATLSFRRPDPLRDLVLHGDLVRLGEAYVLGAVEVEGRMDVAFDIADFLERRRLPWAERLRLMAIALRLPRTASRAPLKETRADGAARANSRASIAHHYDVSNDFYRLWLDPEMVYSCAYFRDAAQPLADAQCDKLDYICRKLRLEPGQRLLDIGCGWGALALWAARHYGVEVHGITLSEQQCGHARERIAREGCADRVHIELRDYRDLPHDAHYDRIVSVGMFEHIGVKNFPVYFGAVQRRLAPGGLFLNHGITNDSGWVNCPSQRFINRYVFPDGELTRVSVVQAAMEQAGFEILDVEGLRPHYAMTLRHWLQALDASRERAEAVAGAIVRRIWRLYMAGSAHYFSEGGLGVYQILAGHRHARQPLPLRRADLYRA